MDDFLIKRTKQLTGGLILSGSLNVGLILALFFVWKSAHTPTLSLEQIEARVEKADGSGKAAVLTTLMPLHYEQLVTELGSKELVEDGYTKRDLALGLLVSKHYFNISKALPGTPLQSRQFLLGSEKITLFPGLSDEQLRKVADYAATEQWPFTSQGLFAKLKEKKEPSLKTAFCMTPEYASLETLTRACGLDVSKDQIVQMLLEGSFEKLQEYAKEGDLSNSRLQKILLGYVDSCSPTAADILVTSYPEFASKKLDDPAVIGLLRQLKVKSSAAENYAKEILLSPRSRAVWQAAAVRLYQFHGEAAPKTFDYRAAVSRFVTPAALEKKVVVLQTKKPSTAPSSLPAGKEKQNEASSKAKNKELAAKKNNPAVKGEKKQFLHVVRGGESLWTIARQYHVDGESLKKANALKNDKIREGQVLIIP